MSDALPEAPHALARRRVVRAIGRDQQRSALAQVVGEEGDEIQCRAVGPVEILEHHQQRALLCTACQQRKRVLEHAQLRIRRLSGQPRKRRHVRPQRVDERLERQLRADEIEAAANHDLESVAAGARGELAHEPRLAYPCVTGDERHRPVSGRRRLQRALKLVELANAPDECAARASFHALSIAPLSPRNRAAGGQR